MKRLQVNKNAIMNRPFVFECPKCQQKIETHPAAPGLATTKCSGCGSRINYKVVVPQPSSLSVHVQKVTGKEKYQYRISETIEVGQAFSYCCPNGDCCRGISKVASRVGDYVATCPQCGCKVAYKAIESGGQQSGQQSSSNDHKEVTEIFSITQDNCSGCLRWRRYGVWKLEDLRLGITTVGRKDKDEPSDVMIDDPTVSARSLEIEVEKSDQAGYTFQARIKRATNPVYINQRQYSVGDSIFLNDGDIIKIGKTILTFKIQDKQPTWKSLFTNLTRL